MTDTTTVETTAPAAGPAPAGDAAPAEGQSSYGDRRPRRDGARGGPRDFRSRRKVCVFCVSKVKEIDYKDTAQLRRFISDRGKIEPRRKSGTCAKHQRRLSTALKRARFMALLPYTGEHIRSIETGGQGGSHRDRTDVGRPDRSQVEAMAEGGASPAGAIEGATPAGSEPQPDASSPAAAAPAPPESGTPPEPGSPDASTAAPDAREPAAPAGA